MTTATSENTRKIPCTHRRSRAPLLVGLLVLALAALGIWWFAIRDGSEVVPVVVTGSQSCSELPDEGGFSWYTCIDTASESRVTGTGLVSLVSPVDPEAMQGTYELTNDGGTWYGPWTGVILADGYHIMDGALEGSGDYEGLQYLVRWEGSYLGNLGVSGTIEPMP